MGYRSAFLFVLVALLALVVAQKLTNDCDFFPCPPEDDEDEFPSNLRNLTPIGSQWGNGWVYFASQLSGDQVFPKPSLTNKRGVVVCGLLRNSVPRKLSCAVATSFDSATAEFRVAHPGLIVDRNRLTSVSLSNGIGSTDITIDSGLASSLGLTNRTLEEDLLNGLWYVEVRGGDEVIRGPIAQDASFIATISRDQHVLWKLPDDDDSDDDQEEDAEEYAEDVEFELRGLGLFDYNVASKFLNWTIVHTVDDVIQSGIRVAPIGRYGSKAYLFERSHSIIEEGFALADDDDDDGADDDDNDDDEGGKPDDDDDADNLPEGDWELATVRDLYWNRLAVQLKSDEHPYGESRGQIFGVAQTPLITHTAELVGENSNTFTLATGCAVFAYNCTNRRLEYYVHHSVLNPYKAQVYLGGQKAFTLDRAESPIVGQRRLTEEQEEALVNGNLDLVIRSDRYRSNSGEISGPISASQWTHAALIGGQYSRPRRTSQYEGCALFNYQSEGRILTYKIQTSLPASSSAGITVMSGDSDANYRDATYEFGIPVRPRFTQQGVHYLTRDQSGSLRNSQLFLSFDIFFSNDPLLRGVISPLWKSQCTSDFYSRPDFLNPVDNDDDDDNDSNPHDDGDDDNGPDDDDGTVVEQPDDANADGDDNNADGGNDQQQ